MPTRRMVMEQALVEERSALWGDLDEFAGRAHPTSLKVENTVGRIRLCCEALGYPSDWRTIPERALTWWELVETMPAESIAPRWDDWGELLSVLTDSTREFHEVPGEAFTAYGTGRHYTLHLLALGDPDE